ncbi:MAG: sulfatase-like hydrolase/transferase [Kiritimatiellales bacterium]
MTNTAVLKQIGVFAAGAGCLCAAPEQGNPQPNILLILADDAGYHDFGFQGDPLYRELTPNIDTIARDGGRFTEAYVSCNVCAPSRAGLMTGMHQQRFGFQNNDSVSNWNAKKEARFGLDLAQKTVADRLKALGYYTGIVGKWHLGYIEGYYPTRRGFDYFMGLRGGSRSFFPNPEYSRATNADQYKQLEKNGKIIPENEIHHVTDCFGDAALEFLDQALHQDHPFFLYLSFTAPHTPLQPDDESLAKAKRLFPDAEAKRQAYLGLIAGMDRNVGRVLDFLREHKLDQNTLVVFLSDNGGSAKNAANNDPLRGHKWTPFEGGYRVPMAVKWPGVIAAGSVFSTPVMSLDLLPTFLKAAGGEVADELDGRDLRSLMEGTPGDDRTFLWRDRNKEGLTSTILRYPWKLIIQDEAPKNVAPAGARLFNLENDMAESHNVAEQYPEIVQKLSSELDVWTGSLPPPRW